MLDLALRPSPSGKFTFEWDAFGDLRFDDRGTYPVLVTLLGHKGRYFWDNTGNQGTRLYQLRRERLTTGSDLVAEAQDAAAQLVAAGLVSSMTAEARRLGVGRWLLQVSWQRANKTYTSNVRL